MNEILVTTAKVKKYIRDKGPMNTSGSVPEALSKVVERVLAKAMEQAKADGRKTVFDRDVEAVANISNL